MVRANGSERWPWGWLVVLAAVCAGCARSSGGGGGGTGGAAASGGAPASAPPAGVWLRGDLHVHTAYSGDAGRFGDDVAGSIRLAEAAGLDFVVLGDHRTTAVLSDPALRSTPTSLTVLAGMEWGGRGHAGAHGMAQAPTHVTQTGADAAARTASIARTIDEVHRHGGFFVLNHPMDPRNPWIWPVRDFDGIEVWNQLWSMRAVQDLTEQAARDAAAQHGLQPTADLLAAARVQGGGANYQALKRWEYWLDQGLHLAAVGGGDRHYLVLPGTPTTWVYARDRSPGAIVEAIRAGRTMVARAPDAAQLEFAADGDGDGVFEALIGDSVPLGRPNTFRLRVTDAAGGLVVVWKNGTELLRTSLASADETITFTDTAHARAWYRVDVFEPLDLSRSELRTLRALVLGVGGNTLLSSLQSGGGLLSGVSGWIAGLLGQVQDVVQTGAPAALWLLLRGSALGVRLETGLGSNYPVLVWPEEVSRVLNTDMLEPDFCRAVISSPIWAQ